MKYHFLCYENGSSRWLAHLSAYPTDQFNAHLRPNVLNAHCLKIISISLHGFEGVGFTQATAAHFLLIVRLTDSLVGLVAWSAG